MLTLLTVATLALTTHAQHQVGGVQIKDHCDLAATKQTAKKALVPYKTEYSKNYRITYKGYDQIKEFKINLLGGVPYRLVFNTEGLPLDVRVLVTDKDRLNKRATTLMDVTGEELSVLNIGGEDDEFDPNKVYVAIFIPAVENLDPVVRQKGCINFIYGTKVLVDESF